MTSPAAPDPTSRPTALPVSPQVSLRRTLLVCLGSTILFHLSFPPVAAGLLGWVALAPLLLAFATTSRRRAALGGALAGLVMALLSLSGFRHLTYAAYIAPAIVAAGYYAIVGAAISHLVRRRGLSLLWAAPPIWAAYEFIRAVIPVIKFPWLLAGQTQVGWLGIIQVADLGGVYVISFIVMVTNAWIAQAILDRGNPMRWKRHLKLVAYPSLLIVAAVHRYGPVATSTCQYPSKTNRSHTRDEYARRNACPNVTSQPATLYGGRLVHSLLCD